jgi:hypothetical protein
MGTWETRQTRARRAAVEGWQQPRKTSEASDESQRGHHSRSVGKPRTGRRATVDQVPQSTTLVEVKAVHTDRCHQEGKRGNPGRQSPCAVKAARTVATGGWEDIVRLRVLSLPTADTEF